MVLIGAAYSAAIFSSPNSRLEDSRLRFCPCSSWSAGRRQMAPPEKSCHESTQPAIVHASAVRQPCLLTTPADHGKRRPNGWEMITQSNPFTCTASLGYTTYVAYSRALLSAGQPCRVRNVGYQWATFPTDFTPLFFIPRDGPRATPVGLNVSVIGHRGRTKLTFEHNGNAVPV